MALSCTYYVPKCGSTRLCDQNCGVQPADRQTHRQTHRHTDRQTQGQAKAGISQKETAMEINITDWCT